MLKNKKFMFLGLMGSFAFALALIAIPTSAQVTTFSQIGGTTMKVGSRGENVRALQQFVASNSDIYPAGLVTGYFGSMTKAAIVQFQLAYDLVADGIAGPATKNKANSIINAGRGIDIYAPSWASYTLPAWWVWLWLF